MRLFLKSNRKNKKTVLLLLGLVVFSTVFFPLSANAAWYDFLVNAVLAVPTALIGAVLGVVLLLAGVFAWIAGAILNWVTGPNFISFSYTNPANNPIIANGLGITKGFVNMLLVVALVYIAVSIALRLGTEGEAKKALVRLILVALLVNFAPVICGLIVDAGNIVMNYFLVGIKDGVSGILTQSLDYFKSAGSTLFTMTGSLSKKSEVLTQGLVGVIFCFALGITFLLYAGIFFFRYFAIWILVILSPLAFIAWAIPLKKVQILWTKWWNNFIQWITIGIMKAFFLYLGMGTYGALRKEFAAKIELPGLETTTATFLDSVLPYFAVIVFLNIGFVMSFATTAWGAQSALSFAKRGRAMIGGWAKGAGLVAAGGIAGLAGKEWLERQASARLMPGKIAQMKGIGGVAAKIGYGALAAPTVWAARRGLGQLGLRMAGVEKGAIRKGEEEYAGASAGKIAAGLTPPGPVSKKEVGILRKAIDEERIDDVRNTLRKTGRTDQEIDNLITKIGRVALRTDPEEFKKIRDAFPHLAEKMGEGFSEKIREQAKVMLTAPDLEKGYKSVEQKLIVEMKTEALKKLDPRVVKRPQIIEALHRFGSGSQITTLTEKFERDFTEADIKEREINKRDASWFAVVNPLQHKYRVTSPTAQIVGTGFPEMATEEAKVKAAATGTLEREKKEKQGKLERGEIRQEDIKAVKREVEDIGKELELRKEIEAREKRERAAPPPSPAAATPPPPPVPGGRPGTGGAGPSPRPPRGRAGAGGV